MRTHVAWARIHATLKSRGFREVQSSAVTYRGQIHVHGSAVDVSVVIPDPTFCDLPVVTLLDKTQLAPDVVGHLFRLGGEGSGICYHSQVGLPVDIHDPGGSILKVLEQTEKTIERSFAGQGDAEVRAEYQDYWRRDGPIFRIMVAPSHESVSSRSLMVYALTPKIGKQFYAISDGSNLYDLESKRICEALLIETDGEIGPCGTQISPTNLDELEQWFEAQSSLNATLWLQARAVLSRHGLVCISAPNANVTTRLDFDLLP